MIQVKNLHKSYAGVSTLHGISFEVQKGEIVGFLGPNGAGKTTTMRILTGFLPPSSGVVKIAGYDILEDSLRARKHIGYLPESVPLYTDLTVAEYLTFFAKLMRIPSKRRASEVVSVMKRTGLLEVSGKLIGSLSRGYKQRVGIAQALTGSPEVLILDEPTVGLDPIQIREIRDLIKDLSKNHTVILSTHILPEVSQICNRVLIINKGRIVADDSVSSLLSKEKARTKLRLVVGSNFEKAHSLIKHISDVSHVELVSEDHEHVLLVESPRDIRTTLLKELVSKNIDLLEFRSERVNLEDVFLKLTTTEKK